MTRSHVHLQSVAVVARGYVVNWLGGRLGDALRPVNTTLRMGRGAQMGVDHNNGFEWVGVSAAFIDQSP